MSLFEAAAGHTFNFVFFFVLYKAKSQIEREMLSSLVTHHLKNKKMKTLNLLSKCFAFSFILLLTLGSKTIAQDCKNFYYMSNNTEVEMTMYDKNGAKSGVQAWKITDVKKDGNDFQSTVNSTFTNEKGEEITKATGTYKCSGGKLMADIRMSIPQDQMKQAKLGEAELTKAYLEYPSNLSEGMQLPDAFFDMEVNTSGIPSTAHFEMKNRKVTGKEKITSDAGSWDAYKIAYDASMKIKMIGIGIPMVMQTTEWFVPDFGVVKSETFSKKGNKMGSTLLTKLKK